MLTKILRLLGFRRRVSTKLTPTYEARRVRELQAAHERFKRGMTA